MRTTALCVACLALIVAAPERAHARPLLVVSAEVAGEIVVIDAAKAQVIERIKVGPRPRDLKLTRDRRRVLVALAGSAKLAPRPEAGPASRLLSSDAGLAVVDIAAHKLTKQVVTAPAPFAVELSPDGRTAYLSNSETNEVLVIDITGGTVKKKIAVGAEPVALASRPDGKVVYAVTRGANELSAIDPKTMSLLGRIDAGMRPQAVVFAPRGNLAFVMGEAIPSVTIIDTKQNLSKENFVLKAPAKAVLHAAVFSPDGKLLYVTTGPGRSVLIVDPAKKAAVGAIEGVGWFPRGIAISPDGKKLYTANGPSDDVSIIDLASNKVEASVAVKGGPFGIVVVP